MPSQHQRTFRKFHSRNISSDVSLGSAAEDSSAITESHFLFGLTLLSLNPRLDSKHPFEDTNSCLHIILRLARSI